MTTNTYQDKTPKLGKRAQALLQKQLKPHDDDSPSTFEEFHDAGADNEESGDRWLGSDLAKSLRFYQKAYVNYLDALSCAPSSPPNWDCSYNCARLLFHVYHTYTVGDGVNVQDLSNVDEVFARGSRSVLQPLSFIIDSHRQLLELIQNSGQIASPDLQFNTAIALTEAIEVHLCMEDTPFSVLVLFAQEAINLLHHLLETQLNDMAQFISELQLAFTNEQNGMDHANMPQDEFKPKGSEQFTNDDSVIQPIDLLETVVAAYKLSTALKEAANTLQEVGIAAETMLRLDMISEPIAQLLAESCCENSASRNELIANISTEQAIELQLAHAYSKAVMVEDFETLLSFWKNPQFPELAERFMSASDSIQHYIDRGDIHLASANSDVATAETFSRGLQQISQNLKRAQELLSERLSTLRKSPSQIGLGSLIAQISEVCIYRADTDLQRSQIRGIPVCEKNSHILLGNAKTLLKNAMTFANTSGGLRERAAETALRELQKAAAVARLCLLDGKTSIEELDHIMGRARWTVLMPKIANLGFYDNYGVNLIKLC